MYLKKLEYAELLQKEAEALEDKIMKTETRQVHIRKRNNKPYYYETVYKDGVAAQKGLSPSDNGPNLYIQYKTYQISKERLGHIHTELKKINADRNFLIDKIEQEYLKSAELFSADNFTQDFMVSELQYNTLHGEKVRSKSEAIIADTLFRYKIPYEYEKILAADGRTHIDFTIKHSIQGCTMYWEHFGLMNDRDYVYNYLLKKKHYEKLGICEGKNLITTYEFYSQYKPSITFDVRQAENVVQKYFLPPPKGVF